MLPVIKRANILVNHIEMKFLILHNETNHESYMHIARAIDGTHSETKTNDTCDKNSLYFSKPCRN